jgi:hypothetical protein
VSISVGAWQYVYGNINVDSEFELAKQTNDAVIKWSAVNFEEGNIYVTDSESSVLWTSLQALGKDSNDIDTSNDFADLDTLLNMSSFVDSITNTYVNSSGSIMNTTQYTIFKQIIDEVPISNSTNNTNFQTGILWDTSDTSGDDEYSQEDGEDIIFITEINRDKIGAYGSYDYEIRIPATLRQYKTTESRKVVFYTELR